MEYISKDKSIEYSGDGYSGFDYPSNDKDINFAIIRIKGRSPKTGYQVNLDCKELLYITSGNGALNIKGNNEIVNFIKGDVIIIDKGEFYTFDGDFEAAVPCTPAWTTEQHKYEE